MPEKNLKARLKDVFIALHRVFKKQKILTQDMVNKEVEIFAKMNGYGPDTPIEDIAEFQNKFIKYLQDKDYSFEGLSVSQINIDKYGNEEEVPIKLPKNLRAITENLNKLAADLTVFVDTTSMGPGLVCYTIEKIEPTTKKPYITYRPTPRVITQVHDSGVNGGTIFFSYNHKFIKSDPIKNNYKVVSEDEVIYSPLTKQQADYICQLLNIQSKLLYGQKMKELAKQKNLGLQVIQQKSIQHTK